MDPSLIPQDHASLSVCLEKRKPGRGKAARPTLRMAVSSSSTVTQHRTFGFSEHRLCYFLPHNTLQYHFLCPAQRASSGTRRITTHSHKKERCSESSNKKRARVGMSEAYHDDCPLNSLHRTIYPLVSIVAGSTRRHACNLHPAICGTVFFVVCCARGHVGDRSLRPLYTRCKGNA
jgi:hypothetical protein